MFHSEDLLRRNEFLSLKIIKLRGCCFGRKMGTPPSQQTLAHKTIPKKYKWNQALEIYMIK